MHVTCLLQQQILLLARVGLLVGDAVDNLLRLVAGIELLGNICVLMISLRNVVVLVVRLDVEIITLTGG